MSSTIKAAIQALKGRIADAYTAISNKGGTLPATQDSANLPTAIASIPSGGGIDISGCVFDTGTPEIQGVGDLYAYTQKIVEIHDEVSTTIPCIGYLGYGVTNVFPMLKIMEFKEAVNLQYPNIDYVLFRSTVIEEVYLPKWTRAGITESFSYNTNLRVLHIPLLKPNPYFGNGCTKLIDIMIGDTWAENIPNMRWWDPTTALSDSDTSLLTAEDIAAGFTSNKEKLLYNIRTHIAALLRTDVGNHTIRFSANILAAIQADADTLAAFPANWTLSN